MRTPFCLAASLVFACGGPTGSSSPPTPITSIAVDNATLAGDRAALTLIVRPQRWTGMTDALAEASHDVIPPGVFDQPVESVLATFWHALAEGLPESLDPERPIVVRLGEGDDDLATVVNAIAQNATLPSLRHVFVFPARSIMAMRADLEARIANHCSAPPSACGGLGLVHLLDDGRNVFVVFGEQAPEDVSALLADPGPVLRWALEGEAAFGALVRAEAMRGATTLSGANGMIDALVQVQPEYAAPMRAMGMSELIGAHLRSSPYGRELSDLAFAVESSPLRVRFAARLTETGVARLRAPASSEAANSGATSSGATNSNVDASIQIRSPFDLRAVVNAAALPFGFRSLDSAASITDAYRSGGYALHGAALASPLSFLRLFGDSPAFEEISHDVRTSVDSELEAGSIHVDVDPTQMIASLGFAPTADDAHSPRVHLRSRVTGGAWTGVISLDADATIHSAGFTTTPSVVPDEQSMLCLERLGSAVSNGFRALAGGDSHPGQVAEALRAEVETHSACVTARALADDVQAYRSALQLLPAP